ncbi:uncharacterized protein LOC127747682 [Arachis duranensis]|uniref:Uncharacterized protein LOC127747682 n=1 Tax=Arachis duranensis TaxID=130453 RepID=A0A9C6TJM3_ARADU|nr:uncharacterized protein LOC127747682 [Arachis duranensis]
MEEAQGYAGGIWIGWNRSDINITVLESNNQYIHTKIETNSRDSWFLTTVYGTSQPPVRRLLWPILERIANNMILPWLLTGDFNKIKEDSEKKGGSPIDQKAYKSFNSWINRCGLIDLEFVGSRFTWRGPIWNGFDRVFKRLDRALSNPPWRTKFHEALVKILPRTNFDYYPLSITNEGNPSNKDRRPFRFEMMWTMQLDFKPLVEHNWKAEKRLPKNLNNLKEKLVN